MTALTILFLARTRRRHPLTQSLPAHSAHKVVSL